MAEWLVTYEGQIVGHPGAGRGGRVRVLADTCVEANKLALSYCERAQNLEGVTVNLTVRVDDCPTVATEDIAKLPKQARLPLRVPRFTADMFTPTEYATAEQKARGANKVLRFIVAGAPRDMWGPELYRILHMHLWHHIAHFNANGFYATWFEHAQDRQRFLLRCVN